MSKMDSVVHSVCVHPELSLLLYLPIVQPLRVVQPDAVCEVGGSTPDVSYGDLGVFPLGEAKQRKLYTS